MRVIDTPGVGSVYSHNTEVAYNYLPQVDAAIFVITVDPPLSAAEQEFLQGYPGVCSQVILCP